MKNPISNDPSSGSVRLQPEYFEGAGYWYGWDGRDCIWQQNKNPFNRAWEKNQHRKLQRIAPDVWLGKILAAIEADREMDAKLTEQGIADAQAKLRAHVTALYNENKEWREQAIKKLEESTRDMNRELVRKERAELERRGVVRGKTQNIYRR